MTTDRFVLLDGLRGIAAIAVIGIHVYPLYPLPAGAMMGQYLAVDFFFALSGFVLAHAYQKQFEGGLTALNFIRLRFVRLYPMYLLGALIALGVLFTQGNDSWSGKATLFVAVTSLLMLPTPNSPYGHGSFYPLNSAAWTLLFELIANLVYVLIWRWITLARLFASLVVLAIILILIIPKQEFGLGWRWGDWHLALVRVLFGFFAGVAIYRLREHMRFPALPAWLSIALLLAVLFIPVPQSIRAWVDIASMLLILPLLLAFSQNSTVGENFVQLSTLLGTVSYGVYILHLPIIGVIKGLSSRLDIELNHFSILVLVTLISFLLAWAGQKYYEKTARHFMNERSRQAMTWIGLKRFM